jgi:hypothetical protein
MVSGHTGTRLDEILTVEARNRLRRLSPRRNAARVLRRIAQRLHPSLLESVVVKYAAGQQPYVDIRIGKNRRVAGYVDYVDPLPETR